MELHYPQLHSRRQRSSTKFYHIVSEISDLGFGWNVSNHLTDLMPRRIRLITEVQDGYVNYYLELGDTNEMD